MKTEHHYMVHTDQWYRVKAISPRQAIKQLLLDHYGLQATSLNKVYQDKADGKTVHVGYHHATIGYISVDKFTPMEREA